MKKIYTVLILLLTTQWVSAQQMLRGTVVDNEGEPVPGASILIKGTSQGTVTDMDGGYALEVPSGEETLVVSFLGFIKKEVSVQGRTKLDVTLQPDFEELEEVVVVGYGTVRKSDLTGAVASVRVEENVARQSTTVDQLLQGRAAGVQVTGGGQPGSGISVKIRGTNSLRGNNEPLYVVDGIIISSAGEDAASASSDGNASQSNQNGLNGINPRDIESIEVLKDASATAIYGSRGANGVVLITTRKGETGKVKINGYVTSSLTNVTKKLDVLNGVEFAQYQNEANVLDGENPRYHIEGNNIYPVTYGTSGISIGDTALQQINWQDEIFMTAKDLNVGLSVSGGSKNGSYYISGGYNDQDGVFENSRFQSADLRMNMTQNLSDNLKVESRFNAFYAEGSFAQDGDRAGGTNRSFINNLLLFDPVIQGDIQDYADDNGLSSPYSWINDFSDISNEERYVGKLALTYKLPVKGLAYEISAGGNIRKKERKRWYGLTTFQGGTANGVLSMSDLESKSYQINNLLRYSKYGKIHNVNAVVGWTIDGRHVENSIYEVQDFATTSFTTAQPFFGQITSQPLEILYQDTKIYSALGRATYNFMGRYVATATFRYDGVSKFKGGNKWSLFPAFALAWNASDESFISSLGIFEELKVRAGWGQIGNHGIQPYQTLANYKGELYATPGDGTSVAFIPVNIANPTLKWEVTEQWNAGVDFGIWNNRITGTVDYYQKYTKDLLQQPRLPASTGFSSLFANLGEISNKGIEFMLNGVAVDKKDFSLTIGGNISFNQTRIEKLGIPNSGVYIDGSEQQRSFYLGDNVSSGTYFKAPANIFMEGEAIGLFFGYETDGIYQSGDEILVAGAQPGDVKIIDQDGDGEITTSDRTIIGDPNPDFVYGINLGATYKRFNINVLINGVYGNDIVNGNSVRLGTAEGNGTNIYPEAYHGAWRPERETNLYPRIGYKGENSASAITDRIVEDGSFMRVGNVTLGYDIPMDNVEGIGSINLYVAGRNLLTLTGYKGYDPEVTSFMYNGSIMGVDWVSVPNTKSITFGANITF
ncbi:TonB-dependent receptor [Marinoscillum sp. MHG1-6]|uniref:SusC/RagA family TonB-linked outer membrane protein n=1 Tax=Marinoscillum sp. MHG1-6 TaxID=2959627 RepID=UPI002157435C|nr:TonB-dependent receptor [Marinoscillum sp. MHG1-6]